MGIELTEDDKIWRKQNIPKVSENDFKKIIEVLGGNCKGKEKEKEKKDDQKIAEIVYKYSNKGRDQLREAVIMEGKPQFIKLDYDKVKNQYFIKPEPKIEEMGIRVLRPPSTKECPFDPFEFRTIADAQDYLLRAMKETPDTLLQKIKIQIKNFNDIDDYTATQLGATVFGSYFQDRFSTVYYILIVGANGTGKTVFGDTFASLAYRAVNITNATEAFWFRVFGTVEFGQVTLIVEEFDKLDESNEVMGMLKEGYRQNARVPRMNNDNTKMDFFNPFGIKIMIAERSPDEDKARGVLDRTFKTKSYKGYPKFNIKEIRNPQGNPERQRHFDELEDLKKLLLMYRLIHYQDPYIEIETGLDGRDEELCKPLLQLLYSLRASEEMLNEIEKTLQHFLDSKNNRKGDSLEGSIYPIVLKTVIELGQDYIISKSEDEDDEEIKRKSISASGLWEQITSSLGGSFELNEDGNIKNPNTFYFDDFGRKYRNKVIAMIRDKFGAEKDHKMKGNNLVFDLERLEKMKKIYESDGKIKTKPMNLDDSLTHPGHIRGRESTDESLFSNQSTHKNEIKQDDSSSGPFGKDAFDESVSHNSNYDFPPKCYRCDFTPNNKQQYDDHCSLKHPGLSGYPNKAGIEAYGLKAQGTEWENN